MNSRKILFQIYWTEIGEYFNIDMEPTDDAEAAIHEIAHGVHIFGDEFFTKRFKHQNLDDMIWDSYPTDEEASVAEIEVSAITSLALKMLGLHSNKLEGQIRKSMIANYDYKGFQLSTSEVFQLYEAYISSQKSIDMARKISDWIQTENYIRASNNLSVVQRGKFWKAPTARRKSLKTSAIEKNAVWCNVVKSKKMARVTA